ncbi:muts domain V-domain-containing protein, partial [Chytriomyces sp. MP71]
MFSSDINKDGLSLFGLLNLTRSPLGKLLLTQWFKRPSLEMDVLVSRQEAIACLTLHANELHVESMRDAISFIGNIPRICSRLKKKLSILDWEALLKFSYYCLKLRVSSDSLKSNVSVFRKVRETFDGNLLKEMGGYINSVIDFEASSADTSISVKSGVDEDLDELRRSFDGLDDLLSHVARDIADSIPDDMSDSLNVIYFPQLGYLITIPLREDMTTRDSFVIAGLDFQFCTEKTIFYKSKQMYEMDEALGDLHSIIVDKEIEIVQRLQEAVSEHAQTLIQFSQTCAELDCLLALAEASTKYGFTRPTLVSDPRLHIVQGRHPLYEQCLENFIGNDTRLGDSPAADSTASQCSGISGDDEDAQGVKVMLVTGPNFSGKSVYMKQVGLIVFMAHIGSFVPARSAIIGITDRIVTRIQAVESDTKTQSAFMLDSQQMSFALRHATRRSLVLIDEYGKGTLHSDGVALFCASVVDFVERGVDCPNVIATTHFQPNQPEIFTHNLLPDSPIMKEYKMDVFQGNLSHDEKLTFLYRVTAGNAGSSLGLYCAKLAGVPEMVIQR